MTWTVGLHRAWSAVKTVGLVALWLALSAPSVAAQILSGDTVQVRSGNHASFARLVLVYPDARRWAIVPTESGYRVDLAGTGTFDVSGVFDLIPRDRIGALSVEPGGRLAIDLGCECHLDVLEIPGRGLVVDVRDGPAPPGNPFDLLRPEPTPAEADAEVPSVQAPVLRRVASTGSRLSFGLEPLSADMPGLTPTGRASAAAPRAPDSSPMTIEPAPGITTDIVATSAPSAAPEQAIGAATVGPSVVELPGPAIPVPLPALALPASQEDRPQAAIAAAPPEADDQLILPVDAAPAVPLPTLEIADAAETDGAVVDPSMSDGAEPAAIAGTTQVEAPDTDTVTADAPVANDVGVTLPDVAARPGRWVAAPARPLPTNPEAPSVDASSLPDALTRMPTAMVPRDLATLLPLRLPPAAPAASVEDVAAAAAFGDMLARQVGRGIAHGVVDAAVVAGTEPAPERQTPADPATEPDIAAVSSPATIPPPDPLDQIEISTALDRARAQESRLDMPAEAQAVCRDDSQFDVATWAEDTGALPDFAARRAAVVGEFDRVDPDALEAAVRYHVAYGFGAEARQLLDGFGTPAPLPPERADVLRVMSHIVDGDAGAATAMLSGQLVCRSRAALWGALAHAMLPPDADYASAAILSAFEELPAELRRSLGPELANRFLQIGDMDTVAALRRSIARIDPPDDAATELAREPGALLEARVDAAAGRAQESEAGLASVARLDGPRAPEAVAELIESRLNRGELPDDDLVASAAALAMEGRGSALGARLRRAEILSHVAREDFDRARDELRRAVAGSEIAAPEVAAIADAYVSAVTARASDRAFLARLPREAAEMLGYGLTPDTRRTAAERLVALGLPEAALPLIDALVSDESARIVAARAWLRLDQPGTALARVAGLTGPDAERLRAEAYEALGDPGTAARVLDGLGDDEAAVAAAWRAGDLDRVSRNLEAPRARMAELVQSEDPRAPESLAPLAEHQDLIADISRRREAIAAELARPGAPPSP